MGKYTCSWYLKYCFTFCYVVIFYLANHTLPYYYKMDEFNDKKKSHRQPHAGRKAERKANKKKPVEKDENGKKIKKKLSSDPKDARNRNPKAFAIQNVQKTERRVRRKEDITA